MAKRYSDEQILDALIAWSEQELVEVPEFLFVLKEYLESYGYFTEKEKMKLAKFKKKHKINLEEWV